MYIINKYHIENDKLYLNIGGDFNSENKYKIQLRIVHQDTFNIKLCQGINIQDIKSISNKETVCCFNLKNIFSEFKVNNHNTCGIDFFISDNKKTERISIRNKSKKTLISNRYFDIITNPFGNYFSLLFKWKRLSVSVDLIINENELKINFTNSDSDIKHILAERRIKSDIKYYDNHHKYMVTNSLCCIPFSYFTENFNDNFSKFVWDFFAESHIDEYGINYLFAVQYSLPKKIIDSDLYRFIIYKSKNNTLVFETQKKIKKAYVKKCCFENENIIIEFKNNFDCLKLIQKECINNNVYFNTVKEMIINDKNIISLNISEFKTLNNFKEYEYIIKLYKNNNEFLICSNNSISLNQKTGNVIISLEINTEENILKIKSASENNKIPIAVFGSCMTRSSFNSKPYFNSDYKNLFEVVYSAVWPSVFSAVSNPVKFNEDDYKNYAEREIPYIKREYNKTFFSELKNSNAEYLLIDFFVDAMHGPRKIDENSYIGYKSYSKNIYHDKLIYNTERYYLNCNNYFEDWKKNTDKFIKEIINIFPFEKIVLVTGGMTKSYIDNDYNVNTFVNRQREFFTYNNTMIDCREFLWGSMNSYFISKIPNIKIIDLKKYNYFASTNHPEHMVPYHYETNYYKSFLGEFCKIVLMNKLNEI